MDMVPGMVTYFWFTPTRTGKFDVLCEELCGIAHFAMRGRVVVDEEDDVRHVARAAADVRADAARKSPAMPPRDRRCMRRAAPVTARRPKAIGS